MSDYTPSDPVEAADFDYLVKTANPLLTNHLRSIVQPKGKKGLGIRDCSDPQLLEVFFRLKQDQSYTSVAKLVQQDWAICTHLTIKSLVKNLQTLKERASGPLTIDRSDPLEKKLPVALQSKALKVEERLRCLTKDLDTLGRLRWLCEEQLNRCLAWEEACKDQDGKSKHLLLKDAGAELRQCFEFHERLASIEIKLDIIKKAPEGPKADGTDALAKLLERLPDDGTQLIEAIDAFATAADKLTLTVLKGDDGTYSLDETTDSDRIKGIALGISGGIAIKHDEGELSSGEPTAGSDTE